MFKFSFASWSISLVLGFLGGLGFYLLIYLRVTVSEKGGGAEERRENFEQTPS